MAQATFLDEASGERFDDELGTMRQARPETDVHDDSGRLIGQVALIHINGQGDTWMARDAHHAEYGDTPGQIMGWAGRFHTETEAVEALRKAVAQRR